MDLCQKIGLGVFLDISVRPAPRWVHKLCPGCNIYGKSGNEQGSLRRYMEMWEIQLINIMHLDLQRKWWNDIKIIRHCLHLDYAMKLEMAIFPIQNMLENAMLIG